MDVAAWLRGLGLEQYAQLFRDNDIDGEILCGMTAEDLKELGISSFGHRRRLLNAITSLGGGPPTRNVAQSAMSVTSALDRQYDADSRLADRQQQALESRPLDPATRAAEVVVDNHHLGPAERTSSVRQRVLPPPALVIVPQLIGG